MSYHNSSFLLAGVGMEKPGTGGDLTTRFRYINLVLGFSGELTGAHCNKNYSTPNAFITASSGVL